MEKEIKYINNEIEVIWKPHLCIHSKLCWTQLPEVFNPKVKKWVNPDGAPTEKIIDQVKKCPSGALSIKDSEKNTANENTNKIEIASNGPILIKGNCEIKHSDGRVETKENITALCRCGQSGNKPFCDGSHKTSNFKG